MTLWIFFDRFLHVCHHLLLERKVHFSPINSWLFSTQHLWLVLKTLFMKAGFKMKQPEQTNNVINNVIMVCRYDIRFTYLEIWYWWLPNLSRMLCFYMCLSFCPRGVVYPSACRDAHPLPDKRQATPPPRPETHLRGPEAGTPPPDQTQAPPRTRRRHPLPRRPEADPFPSGAVHAGRYGQQAVGTHPTGMYACLYLIFCHTVHKKRISIDLFHSFRL